MMHDFPTCESGAPGGFQRLRRRASSVVRLAARQLMLLVGCCIIVALSGGTAAADTGNPGPPPTDPEIQQAITDLYTRGQPLGTQVSVQFVGPIMVGPITERERPGDAWCVVCAQHFLISSPMYPVYALANVTTTYALESSAVIPSEPVKIATQAGTRCIGGGDCAYYFYRDGNGSWQVL